MSSKVTTKIPVVRVRLAAVDSFLSNLAQQQSGICDLRVHKNLKIIVSHVPIWKRVCWDRTMARQYPPIPTSILVWKKSNSHWQRIMMTTTNIFSRLRQCKTFHRGAKTMMELYATSFQLSQEETQGLIATCKAHNFTIQAALNEAFALAQISKLQTPIPCLVPIQIPMNCRVLAVNDNYQSDSCLCGSAGLWQVKQKHL
jgi:hypothetical protein